MKRFSVLIILFILIITKAQAESGIEAASDHMNSILEFAKEYGADETVNEIYEAAMKGENVLKTLLNPVKSRLAESAQSILKRGFSMLPYVLLLAMLRCMNETAKNGAAFLIRMRLILCEMECAQLALEAAGACIGTAKSFTDAVSPTLALVLTTLGMEGSAALVSPAASLAGNLLEGIFKDYGLPLCRIMLCLAAVSSLSDEIRMDGFLRIFQKISIWGTGLAIALFTGLLSLQGNVSSAADGIGMRTAKYAVDSAAPIIGSGVSDAWESYVSGVMVAKNALGVSGIAVLFLAGAGPVFVCLLSMALNHLLGALLETADERKAARGAYHIGGVCQTALSLCATSLAVSMILLGAMMAAGRGFMT